VTCLSEIQRNKLPKTTGSVTDGYDAIFLAETVLGRAAMVSSTCGAVDVIGLEAFMWRKVAYSSTRNCVQACVNVENVKLLLQPSRFVMLDKRCVFSYKRLDFKRTNL
jgi:hypothetical protein